MPSRAHQSASQVPGEEAFDTDDQIRPVGRDGLEKWLWAGWQIPVHQDLPLPVHHTEIHGAGVQIDAAVKLMLVG
jgi:hypothetical protein